MLVLISNYHYLCWWLVVVGVFAHFCSVLSAEWFVQVECTPCDCCEVMAHVFGLCFEWKSPLCWCLVVGVCLLACDLLAG